MWVIITITQYSSIIMQNYNSSRKFESLKFLMGMDLMSAVTRATVTNNNI